MEANTQGWAPAEGIYWSKSLIEVLECDGIPVLVHSVGSYPHAVNRDGVLSSATQNAAILIGGHAINGVEYFSGASIRITSPPPGGAGYHRHKIIWNKQLPKGEELLAPDALIAEAKNHLEELPQAFVTMDAEYDASEQRIREGWQFKSPLTRENYEAACLTLSVRVLSDEECDSYGVKYGDFTYPHYDADHIVTMHLAFRRLQAIQKEQKTPAPTPVELPATAEKQGQLWEPCECCGKEPCYMPLHLCDRCWPK